jgi:cytochrome c553
MPVTTKPRIKEEEAVCFKCHQTGHFQKNCPVYVRFAGLSDEDALALARELRDEEEAFEQQDFPNEED